MKDQEDSGRFQHWEKLYREALFEADLQEMPRRIQVAKHAISIAWRTSTA